NGDDDSSLLVIDQLSPDDSGNYSCHVSNQFGSDIQSTILTVKAKIEISHSLCLYHHTNVDHTMFFIWKLTILLSLSFSTIFAEIRPKIAEFKQHRSQKIGTKFKIVCIVQEGTLPLKFRWQKNGIVLSNNDSHHHHHHRIETRSDESQLTIDSLQMNDGGNYSCHVRNDAGSDSQLIALDITGLIFCLLSCFSNDMWRIFLLV
ncbi:hypothetical protein BLA29_005465, partial [Euroglyphus maynei]